MTFDDIQAAQRDRRPLTLHLADGRALEVRDPSLILFSPARSASKVVIVFQEPRAEATSWLTPACCSRWRRERPREAALRGG